MGSKRLTPTSGKNDLKMFVVVYFTKSNPTTDFRNYTTCINATDNLKQFWRQLHLNLLFS